MGACPVVPTVALMVARSADVGAPLTTDGTPPRRVMMVQRAVPRLLLLLLLLQLLLLKVMKRRRVGQEQEQSVTGCGGCGGQHWWISFVLGAVNRASPQSVLFNHILTSFGHTGVYPIIQSCIITRFQSERPYSIFQSVAHGVKGNTRRCLGVLLRFQRVAPPARTSSKEPTPPGHTPPGHTPT